MFAIFLWWLALLIVLAMVMQAPVPKRFQVWGLVGLVLTLWFVWGWYGVEYFADAKWPKQASTETHEAAVGASFPGSDASNVEDKKAESPEGPTARLGQVGDMFGGINALFAALAFAGVAIAARLQARSTEIAFRQAIEATFFSALELHHRIADGLKFEPDKTYPDRRHEAKRMAELGGAPASDKSSSFSGREVFAGVLQWASKEGNKLGYEKTIANYRHLQIEHNYVLGHYFRNLYQLLKLVNEDTVLDARGKQRYASILRAQLSTDELALLMVNCAGDMVDEGQFRSLLVHYRMLEHLPLAKEGHEYVRAASDYRVVLADEASIAQYISTSLVATGKKEHHGAFGSNPAFGSRAAAAVTG